MEGEEIDYARMYRKMVRATEKAMRILIQAQQECEQMYICAGEKGNVIKLDTYGGKEK